MLDIGLRTPMIHSEQYFIPAFPWSVDVAQVLTKGLREFLYTYIKYFVETNGQLMSLWKNGEMRAKKAKAKKEQPADVVDYAELDRKWAEANAKLERKLAHG